MEELIKRAGELLAQIPNRPNSNEAAPLFALHNEIFPGNKEHGMGCGGCRQRVRDRVNAWYDENKPKDEQ